MRRWAAVMCVVILAGCADPRVSVTDASPARIEFLVRDARLSPMQDVDELAASHCRRYGLSYRRTDAVWVSAALERVAYKCEAERPLTRKLEVRRAPAHAAHPASIKPPLEDPKVAAWTKAKEATDAWVLCLQLDAERKANETAEAPQSVAQEVVGACSALEHAVHEPLEAVGEDSSRFQTDLHAQAVQNARDAVAGARIRAGAPVAGPPAF